ncbi:MAG: 3'(2'),5'-bisphosphate nucleotidase CysQ [Hyphomicrobiales bacterium]|nr:3'(2'),5'-bisphosphate nucleotidase CysQ [Hyphomicrobiales bacterium]
MNVDADRSALAARDCLAAAAREAGALTLGFFRLGAATSAEVQSKFGGSPVTEADLAADALLNRRLREAFPDAGWLSEETADDAERLERRSLLVVDPIDGTRAFVTGDPRWAVSAALVVDGRPVAGVVHAPALDETYAAARGAGATFNEAPISVAGAYDPRRFSAAGPKPILEAMGARLGATVDIAPRVPSLAYRLCLVVRGAIHFAVAGANSHDWDIAAADLLLEEAGARLTGGSGERLLYNTRHIRRGALLGVPEPLAPRLLEAFRAAAGV